MNNSFNLPQAPTESIRVAAAVFVEKRRIGDAASLGGELDRLEKKEVEVLGVGIGSSFWVTGGGTRIVCSV